jgi:Ankyrin repeats (3 copies)
MVQAPDGHVVEKAERKSQDLLQNYLMTEATTVHELHAPLVNFKKPRKDRVLKEKKDKKKRDKEKKRKSAPRRYSNKSIDSSTASDSGEDIEREPGSPVTMLLDNLRKVAPKGKSPRTFCSLQMYDVFEEWTDEQKRGYDTDSIKAIRSQDIDTLRMWHQNGRILQAANEFGESLLHMACRRGFLGVVEFLVDEVGHNLWVRDDTGRTPLHDACWTAFPVPELVKFIIDREPDMLLVADKRGHTPLDYARKDHWQTWMDFFAHVDFHTLLPRREFFYIDEAAVIPAGQGDGQIVDNLDAMFAQLHVDEVIRRGSW